GTDPALARSTAARPVVGPARARTPVTAAVRGRRAIVAGGVSVLLVGGVTIGLLWRNGQVAAGGSPGAAQPAFAEQFGPVFGGGEPVTALAVGELDGRTVVAAGGRRGVELWDPVTGKRLATTPKAAKDVASLEFVEWPGEAAGTSSAAPASTGEVIPAGTTSLAWTSGDGQVWHWFPKGERPLDAFAACRSEARLTIVRRAEGPAAVVGCADGMVQPWDLRTGKKSGRFFKTGRPITGLAAPESGTVAVSTSGGGAQLFHPWGRVKDARLPTRGEVLRVAARSGQPLAVAVRGAGADLYDYQSGELTCRIAAPGLTDVAVAEANGRGLVVGAGHGLQVWDAATCEPEEALLPDSDDSKVTALAVGVVQGKQAAVASVGGKMRVWSLELTR
ncbi:WD40 repeat domain-containing protein, partial [Nonomuraea sp. NPDC005983]|uniref:WD40 repeat domain-containing protein n=1 Tax=Nonomuraea sp. NPDC005983 TaxID=3155595 RepID=UPI0033A65A30